MFTLFTQQDLEAVGARLTSSPGRYQAVHMPGTAQAYVTRDDGETVWADVEGVWLTRP